MALRITLNTDKDAFFGKKYNVEKLFEDDGNVASGITVATYDSDKKKLFLSGEFSRHDVLFSTDQKSLIVRTRPRDD